MSIAQRDAGNGVIVFQQPIPSRGDYPGRDGKVAITSNEIGVSVTHEVSWYANDKPEDIGAKVEKLIKSWLGL